MAAVLAMAGATTAATPNHGGDVSPAAPRSRRLRTRTSRTYAPAEEDTELNSRHDRSTTSIHYRDGGGRWPSDLPRYGLRNRVNRVRLTRDSPSRATNQDWDGAHWISLSFDGAAGIAIGTASRARRGDLAGSRL